MPVLFSLLLIQYPLYVKQIDWIWKIFHPSYLTVPFYLTAVHPLDIKNIVSQPHEIPQQKPPVIFNGRLFLPGFKGFHRFPKPASHILISQQESRCLVPDLLIAVSPIFPT